MAKQYVVKRDEAVQGFYQSPTGRGGTLMRFMIDEETSGGTHFAMMANQIAAGTQAGPGVHSHATEHGFYILSGKARFMIEDQEHIVGPHTSVFIPANVPHSVASASDEPLEYVAIYAPQGPERELRRRLGK